MLCWSQPVRAAGDAAADVARYDQLLMGQDYQTLAAVLGRALAQPGHAFGVLQWERDRLDQGAGLFVAGMRAVHLYTVGRAGGTDDPRTDFADLAVEAGFYTLALIEIDGARCARVGPQNVRRRQFAQILAPIWNRIADLDDDAIAHLIGNALIEEQTTAAMRGDDAYLCRGVTPDIPPVLIGDEKPRAPRFKDETHIQQSMADARQALPGLLISFAAEMRKRYETKNDTAVPAQ